MGVPLFYRWLTNKYPKSVSDAIEENYGKTKVESTSPNPSGVEFDNLYLDMNGIIHDNVSAPTTFEEVFDSIKENIDRIFNIVRPRKLLYMAIDGEAPLAKMNWPQRERSFRSSKDTQIAEEMEDKLREEFERQGKSISPKQQESQVADKNEITPGTEFMNMLSKKLQSYITLSMNENPAWKKIKVILSDDTVPGEGEHKIMSFIRAQRSLPGYDPNTRHCLYGWDADLIMLALATHEIHFSMLRENVLLSLKTELSPEMSLGCSIPKAECNEPRWKVTKRRPYQFLNLWVLREYLALDLDITSPPEKFEYDLERIIDDFIFICFFAGNDFLPHMPSLEVHECCIDLLMHVYKKEFHYFGGYLVDMQKVEDQKGEYINLKRVERFILSVGTYEEKIFCKRSQIREKNLRRFLAEYRDAKKDEKIDEEYGTVSDVVLSSAFAADFDEVKFGTPGWRERYYEAKFSALSPGEREETRKIVVAKYGEGLCWVLLCYFSGVPSWTWFYPFDYGPFASDLKGLAQTNTEFQKDLPFQPFDQLMGVRPPTSAHALPSPYKMLMTEEQSNIIDFYPKEFQTDVDGKRFMWQLPFIEENRLLTETRKLENELKDHEKLRNLQSLDLLFVQCANHGSVQVEASKKIKDAIMMECTIEGVKGTIHMMPENLLEAVLLEAVEDNKGDRSRKYTCVFYETHQNFQFVPRLLSGVKIPEKTVDEKDIIETVLWHERYGNRFYQNRRPSTKPYQKQDFSPQNARPGCGFTNTDRGKTSAASKTLFEIKPGQQIHSGFGGRISDTGPQPVFDYKHQPAGSSSRQSGGCATYNTRPDSENVWRKNPVGISSQTDSPKEPFSADTGRDKERGRFQDPRAIIQDTKQNSSTQNVSPSVSQGSGRGSNFGGGRASVSDKSVSELQHGTFFRDNDHQPSIPKSEHDGRSTADSIRRDVYRAPRPLLSNRHEPVGNFWQSHEGGTHDTNRDWRASKPSEANMGSVWTKDFAQSSNKMENPNRPFSAYTGRGRGRGRNAT